jgi:hypothetical protein
MLDTKLWHKRLRHINKENFKQLKDLNLVKGLSLKEITKIPKGWRRMNT